jgi:hypothetical protein
MCKSTFIASLALLTLSTSQAAFSQQNDCEWQSANLMLGPNYHTQEYIPPHTRGDADFMGHGPNVSASLNFQVQPRGIYAEVWMKAEETKKDWTTAEGRTTLWFLRLNEGWVIQKVAEQLILFNGNFVPNGKVLSVPSSSFLNFSYRDNNHDIDVMDVGDDLVSSVQFVGDIRGDDAGIKTKIIVGSKIGAFCIARLSN